MWQLSRKTSILTFRECSFALPRRSRQFQWQSRMLAERGLFLMRGGGMEGGEKKGGEGWFKRGVKKDGS